MNQRNRLIDCLKGLAILGVIVYHFSPSILKGGYIGVPLFFIISGYLLAKNTKKATDSGRFNLKSYYQSRLVRLYPILFLFVGVISIWSFFFSPRLLNNSASEFLSIFLGYNNFWQIAQNLSYFDRISNASAFTHLWFLAIQLQMYLIWPLLFALYLRIKQTQKRAYDLFLILAILSFLSMTIGYLIGIDISTLYYHTFTRMSALFLGAWIGLNEAYLVSQFKNRLSEKNQIIGFISVSVLNLLFAVFLEGKSSFTYIIGLNLVTLAQGVLLIYVLIPQFTYKNYFFLWLGQRSYELYLWHYPIFFLFRIMKAEANFISFLAQIILLFFLTELSYQLGKYIAKLFKTRAFLNKSEHQKTINIRLAILLYFAYCGVALAVIYPLANPQTKTDLAGELAENSQLVANQSLAPVETTTESSQETTTLVANETTGEVSETTEETTVQVNDDVTHRPITMIGDSVMLGTFKELKEIFPNSYIDAEESRQAYDIVPLLNALNANGNLANTVIISLGTNGYFQKFYGEEIMSILGPDRTVFWINVYGQYLEWENSTNAMINELVAQYPNLYLIDWATNARNNPAWLIEDGIHPNVDGRAAYAAIVEQGIRAVLEGKKKRTIEDRSLCNAVKTKIHVRDYYMCISYCYCENRHQTGAITIAVTYYYMLAKVNKLRLSFVLKSNRVI